MFDWSQPGSIPVQADTAQADTVQADTGTASAAEDAPVPLERLEAQICELAGHLTAATCRFLILLADFEARRGWSSWDMRSCAEWLSWKCQMSSGAAREHVRVAKALPDLPVIRAEFGAGRLSYAKVRALTRIATPENEADLAELAGPMTGNQLERFARAHRRVSQADDEAARIRQRLTWRFEEDGSLAGTFRLPPLQGTVLLQALRAAAADLEQPDEEHPQEEHPHGEQEQRGDVSAETSARRPRAGLTSTSLADALVTVAEAFLGEKVATADNPEAYQVVVHVGTEAAGVSAETSGASHPRPGDPADPARCHVEDGPAISPSTAQMIGCTAALSWMQHGSDGSVLRLGRRRRRPSAAMRRAARERDTCHCRYPGCESRRVDLHHIQYWSNGGRTDLDNLISLCKYHHMLVHKRGHIITPADGGFSFCRPDGTELPGSPGLPEPDGTIEDCHDADIAPGTIVPSWYGERLDLDYAIAVCFANAETRSGQRERPEPETEPYVYAGVNIIDAAQNICKRHEAKMMA